MSSITKTKKSAFETRAEQEVDNQSMILGLVLVLALVFLGFVPEARNLIGTCLILAGDFISVVGHTVIQEQNAQFVDPSVQQGDSFWWLFGFVLMVSPFVTFYMARMSGWRDGMKQASEEVKDARSQF